MRLEPTLDGGRRRVAEVDVGAGESPRLTLDADGGFTYEPSPNEDGLDTFTVRTFDPIEGSATATITVEIFAWGGTRQFGTAAEDFATTSGLFFDLNGDLIIGGATEGQIGSTASAGGRGRSASDTCCDTRWRTSDIFPCRRHGGPAAASSSPRSARKACQLLAARN